MNLWGNLFVKIFVGFWLVTLAILTSWTLATHYFDSRPWDPGLSNKAQIIPRRFMLRTIYQLQHLDESQLGEAVAQVRKKHGLDIYLLERNGSDLLGRAVPPIITENPQLLHGRRRQFLNTPQGRVVAHEIYRRDQGPLRALMLYPKSRRGVLHLIGVNPWLRIGLAVIISGLICFALSRIMTTRLKALQSASRRLANGELQTRIQVRQRGGDETDELARYFNTMAEQLQARIQKQKTLLGDVSHELRSPLTRLRLALALAQNDGLEKAKYLDRIEQEAERLEELISQLLSSQLVDISMDAHIDLVPLISQLCRDANFEGQEQGKQFTFSTDTDQAIVASSGDLLHKTFDNMLRNALAHTAENTAVHVRLNTTAEHYHVSIEDQGPGIPADELDNIFDEFYRVDAARTPMTGGYGLGLAIARRAITEHNGKIRAQNTASGLKITVSLPLQSE